MKYLLVVLLFVAQCAYSTTTSMIMEGDHTTIRLLLGPCLPPAANQIQPKFLKDFREAKTTVNGHDFKACWIAPPNADTIGIVDEEGDSADIPKSRFKIDEGI